MRNALSELLRIAQLLVSSIEAEETERDTKREREREKSQVTIEYSAGGRR